MFPQGKFLQGYIGELFPPMFLESFFRAIFSSDIFGSNSIFKYLFVLIYFFCRFFQIFFWWGSFENCFVEISLFLFRGVVVDMVLPILFW